MYSMMFSGRVYNLISIGLLNNQMDVPISAKPKANGKMTCFLALNSNFFLFLVPIHVMQIRMNVQTLL